MLSRGWGAALSVPVSAFPTAAVRAGRISAADIPPSSISVSATPPFDLCVPDRIKTRLSTCPVGATAGLPTETWSNDLRPSFTLGVLRNRSVSAGELSASKKEANHVHAEHHGPLARLRLGKRRLQQERRRPACRSRQG